MCIRSWPESATSVPYHFGRPYFAKEVAFASLEESRLDCGCGFRLLAGGRTGDQAADDIAKTASSIVRLYL